jgi:hypothetical protein
MNTKTQGALATWSTRRPHLLLLTGHLLLLHALAFGGWQIPAVRILWLGALGAISDLATLRRRRTADEPAPDTFG